jgi:hypothetical protein
LFGDEYPLRLEDPPDPTTYDHSRNPMLSPNSRVLAVLLLYAMFSVGCNRSDTAGLAQAKSEAEAARAETQAAKADLAKATAELATLRSELASLKNAKPEPAKNPGEDADRKAAEWVVRSGGTVRVSASGVIGEYPKDGKLPDGGFRVIAVDLLEPGRKGRLSNEGVKHLEGLKYLTSLRLLQDGDATGVTDFSFLSGLVGMEHLHFNGSRITDAGLAHLKGLTKLKTLDVEHFFGWREITDVGLQHLKDLKDLEVLWLWGTNITDAGLDNLHGLTNLKRINFGRTPISDAGLARLKGLNALRELHMAETPVTDAGLDTLKGLSKLEFVNLQDTKVSDAGAKAFAVTHPKCKIHRPEKK